MTNKHLQNIFRNATVDRLRNDLKSGKSLMGYLEKDYPVKTEDLLPSTIEVSGKVPTLEIPVKGRKDFAATECENAIQLHEYYKNIDETQASDQRLWTYLSHVEFRDYSLARWAYPGSVETEQDSAITFYLDRWFIRDNDRGLRHQAIARLWWTAHLTYAPWEKDPEFFGDLKRKDPYHFTKVLLFTEDIYQTFLERGLGRSNRILISVLEYLDENEEFRKSRDSIRNLAKELNLVYGVKKLISLSRVDLKVLIEKIASESKA